jgi:hypothetical protein
MKKHNLKVTGNLLTYIKHIDTLGKTLTTENKKELENLLRAVLVILISLKRGTKLGTFSFND